MRGEFRHEHLFDACACPGRRAQERQARFDRRVMTETADGHPCTHTAHPCRVTKVVMMDSKVILRKGSWWMCHGGAGWFTSESGIEKAACRLQGGTSGLVRTAAGRE